MSLVAEFEVASANLLLGPTLEAFASLDVELERQFALDPDRPISFCWIRGVEFDCFEDALERDDTVGVFDRLETTGDRALYRITHHETGVVGAYRQWVSVGAELLDGRGTGGCWEIRMRFPDRNAFATYYEFLDDRGVSFDLHRLSDGGQSTHDDLLTTRQRDALRIAYEDGFFDVPRGATLEDIANELEISDQAVSERLRRGQSRLIEQHVL